MKIEPKPKPQIEELLPEKRPCQTCNAGYGNDVKRIVRCGTCLVRPNAEPTAKPTKWSAE